MKLNRMTFWLFVSLILVYSCKKDDPAKLPVLSSAPVTNITVSAATGGGNITSDGGATITASGVCWGTSINPATSDSKTSDNVVFGQFVSVITGLNAGSTYHVRAFATNIAGTAYGADITFSTLGQIPSGVTLPATNVTTTSATLNGTVNPNFLSSAVTFEYGITTSYGQTISATQSPVSGNNTTNASADITGLSAATTYHFRLKIVNSLGTVYGSDMTCVTTGQAPTAITQPACCLSGSEATLNGTVNANYLPSDIIFEYGTTKEYGYSVTGEPGSAYGSSFVNVTAVISGLIKGTTYYFRIKATNDLGTSYGNQLSFTASSSILFNPGLDYGSVTDIDGNSYRTIRIGNQTWMAENLRTATYNDGTPIPNVTNQGEWNQLLETSFDAVTHEKMYNIEGAYCWYNNDSATFENDYGKLYNFGVAESGKVCPVGWHVPTRSELDILCNPYRHIPDTSDPEYPNGISGNELMETGTNHWLTSLGTNETGYTSLPGGGRYSDRFDGSGTKCYFWSSGRVYPDYGPNGLYYPLPVNGGFSTTPISTSLPMINGFSIRCIQD